MLGKAKIPKAAFENTDGTALLLNEDYFGSKRSENSNLTGPFVNVNAGKTRLKIW